MEINKLGHGVVWVVIPTFNRCDILSSCLQDLLQQDYQNTHIIVVDDDSSDGTLEMLRAKFPSITVLKGDGNRWWSGAMNLGLGWIMANATKDDYLLSFNDDVRVDRGYLKTLVTAAKCVSPFSIIGSVAVDSADTSKVVYCGTCIDWRRGLWKGLSKSQLPAGKSLIPTDSLPGRGALIPIDVVAKIGFYNDRRFPQYFGDEDFALRARAAGAELYVSRDAIVKSHVHLTGTGRHTQTLSSFCRSLWSIRSPNQLSRRFAFISSHCPPIYKIQFWLLDLIKVTTAYWRRKEIRT